MLHPCRIATWYRLTQCSLTLCSLALFALLLTGCAAHDPTPLSDTPMPVLGTSPQPRPTQTPQLVSSMPSLSYHQWTIEETTVDALGRIGQPAVPALVNLLHDRDAGLREEAARTLARIGPVAQEAIPELIAALESESSEPVRRQIIRALGQMGPAAGVATPILIEELKKKS